MISKSNPNSFELKKTTPGDHVVVLLDPQKIQLVRTSGDYYANNVRVTNVVVQFVKGDKLYTLLGSTFPRQSKQ